MSCRFCCCVGLAFVACVLLGCGQESRSRVAAAGHRALMETSHDEGTAGGMEDPRQRGITAVNRGHSPPAIVTEDIQVGETAEELAKEIEDDG